jgi:hypothetical protein
MRGFIILFFLLKFLPQKTKTPFGLGFALHGGCLRFGISIEQIQ